MPSVPESPEIVSILKHARTIAVVGLSPRPERPSHSVARYLQRAGYEIIPVRPGSETEILGEPVVNSLEEAARRTPIDIVDVFRRSSAIPELVDPVIRVRPRLVWLQLGIRHDDAVARIEAAGIPVVVDHCLAVEHHSLLGA